MKTLLIITFSIVTIIVAGQDFAPINAKWYFTENFAFDNKIDYFELIVDKDTTINEIQCKKITKNKIQGCGTRPKVEYLFENDSNEVFFYDNEINKFQKLWDFDAKKGDSWSIMRQTDTIITYYVDSVSQIMINGSNLNQLFITYTSHMSDFEVYPDTTTIIENIGDINYFFPWNYGACDGNYAQGLRCYSDDQLGNYITEIAESCDYKKPTDFTSFYGTNQTDIKSTIYIFPNPSKNTLTINTTNPIDVHYEIYEINGTTIKVGNGTVIDLTEIQNGLYIIQIHLDNKCVTKRFIKHLP